MRIFIARRGDGATLGAMAERSSLSQLLLRWAVLAVGVVFATALVPGIQCNSGVTLFVVVILLSFFNAILKPLLVLFTLPFILLTMGLGVVVINALLFLLVGRLVNGFYVAGFWSAFFGALIVSVTNLVLSGLTAKRPGPPPPGNRPPPGGDVIDI
ncbi:MAG TPA: phage holin family protein [Opitutus sp.]|nr:phage holin family protein [Opitutus sp.]